MSEQVTSIATQVVRNLDNYTVPGYGGAYQIAYYPIYTLDSHDKVTDIPMTVSSDSTIPTMQAMASSQEDRVVRDEKTGRLYYQTIHQSRFLDYGLKKADSTGKSSQLVAMDYSGNTKTWNLDDAGGRPDMVSGEIYTSTLSYSNLTFKNLSISRLLVLVTLKRAEEMEASLLTQIQDMATSNAQLDSLSQIADLLVDPKTTSDIIETDTTKITYKGVSMSIYDFLASLDVDIAELYASKPADGSPDKILLDAEFYDRFWHEVDYDYYNDNESAKKALAEGLGVPTSEINNYDWSPVMNSALNNFVTARCNVGKLNLYEQITIPNTSNSDAPLKPTLEAILNIRLKDVNGVPGLEYCQKMILKDDLLDIVKNKQDELNNMSQETMLNIQKLITARDQAYLLGSIGTKLFQNGNVMIARNI